MNILLINPLLTSVQSEPRFPLGLGYIASVLRDDGHDIKVIDANALKLSEDEIEKIINTFTFDVVGITGLITQFKQVQRYASIIKKTSNATVILGGGLASAAPEVVLSKTNVDIVVIGEGEKTASELFQAIKNGISLENMKGICFKKDGKLFRTEEQKGIEDVTSLPFPAWDLFPMDRYFTSVMCMPNRRISIITSRGCPYHCTFCFHGIFGHRFRARTAENVAEEIELLSKRYGVRGINFEDDTFILDRQRVYEICDLLIKKNLKLIWTCNSRIDFIDNDLLNKMKSAGCVHIAYGIESGSQKILNNIGKGIEVTKARKIVKLTWETGIVPHGFMMLGIPGETRQTIRESINFCKEAGISAEFSIATPIPGTRLYQEAVNRGRIDSLEELVKNWGGWFEEVLVDLTNISKTELKNLKKRAEKEVFICFVRNRKKHLIRMLIREIKINGVEALMIRLLRGLRLIFRVSSGRGLSGIRKGY